MVPPSSHGVSRVPRYFGYSSLTFSFAYVALNSYRGNGGGELLTKGAGIPQDKLKERIIRSTDKDLRYYLMQYIERKKVIEPRALGQWKFVPEEWAAPASKRDYEFLFGKVQE